MRINGKVEYVTRNITRIADPSGIALEISSDCEVINATWVGVSRGSRSVEIGNTSIDLFLYDQT
jgi:hypothetical protein